MTPYVQMLWNRLPAQTQGAFGYEYQRYAKDPTVALTLTILLGLVGGEAYYLGDYKRGILMTLALLSGVGLFISVPMWIARCFTIANDCDYYNDYLAYMLAVQYTPGDMVQSAAETPMPPTQASKKIGGLPMRVRTV